MRLLLEPPPSRPNTRTLRAPSFPLSSRLSGLPAEDDTFPGELISWLEPGVTHSWLVSGGRNRYIKSKQFLSRLRTACGARGEGPRAGVITAVETTF